jgi:serine/threonine protein kinase
VTDLQEYSVAVDMWSAGIILFVLVTGYSPFSGDSDAELFEQIRKGAYEVSDVMWEKISDEAKDLVVGTCPAHTSALHI